MSYEKKYAEAVKQTKRVEKAEAKDKHPKSWDSYISKRQAQVKQQSNDHAKVGSI